MSAAGDARRAHLGPAAVAAARDAARNDPPLSPEILNALAILLRKAPVRPRPGTVGDGAESDVA